MPVEQRISTVTPSADADARLKEAFRSLAATSPRKAPDDAIERVWRAVAGELPAEERRELVDRVAADPAYAEAWRIAHELRQAERGDSEGVAPAASPSWSPAWLGLAAALLFAVGVAIVQIQRSPADTFRTQASYVIESPIPSDASLSRDAFVLRWAPGPEGTRYQVRVTTEDLRVIATANDVAAPEFRVAPEQLSSVSAGSRVFWQVVASLPGGERVSSQTFSVRTQ
jgi:hypothetical protein